MVHCVLSHEELNWEGVGALNPLWTIYLGGFPPLIRGAGTADLRVCQSCQDEEALKTSRCYCFLAQLTLLPLLKPSWTWLGSSLLGKALVPGNQLPTLEFLPKQGRAIAGGWCGQNLYD
jgi:hypothetical protein